MRRRPPPSTGPAGSPPPELLLGELIEVWAEAGDADPQAESRRRHRDAVRAWAHQANLSHPEAASRTRTGALLRAMLRSGAREVAVDQLLAAAGVTRADLPALREAAASWGERS